MNFSFTHQHFMDKAKGLPQRHIGKSRSIESFFQSINSSLQLSKKRTLSKFIPKIYHEEAALGTLEIVVITGILLTIALLFNREIRGFANNLFSKVFNDSRILSNIM